MEVSDNPRAHSYSCWTQGKNGETKPVGIHDRISTATVIVTRNQKNGETKPVGIYDCISTATVIVTKNQDGVQYDYSSNDFTRTRSTNQLWVNNNNYNSIRFNNGDKINNIDGENNKRLKEKYQLRALRSEGQCKLYVSQTIVKQEILIR